MNKKMDDNSIMPFGKHKGKKMANVPGDYLKWLYKERKAYGKLKAYIEENLDVIKFETTQKK